MPCLSVWTHVSVVAPTRECTAGHAGRVATYCPTSCASRRRAGCEGCSTSEPSCQTTLELTFASAKGHTHALTDGLANASTLPSPLGSAMPSAAASADHITCVRVVDATIQSGAASAYDSTGSCVVDCTVRCAEKRSCKRVAGHAPPRACESASTSACAGTATSHCGYAAGRTARCDG